MIASYDVMDAPRHSPIATLDSLRKDFRDYWLATSTRNVLNRDNLSGRVVHNYGSKNPISVALDEIPVLEGSFAPEVVKTRSGLLYVRALANDASATADDLVGRLADLSQKDPKDIRIWTPSQASRKDVPERAVGFVYYRGRFHVDGYYGWVDGGDGRSRGVSVGAEGAKRKK